MITTNYICTIQKEKKNMKQKTFHQRTVPGFIYGCMAQFPVDTKSRKILYSAFGRYLMLAKEA